MSYSASCTDWRALLAILIASVCVVIGCGREHYRRDADQEAYSIIREKMTDPRWTYRDVSVDAPVESRLYDVSDPDRPAMPPDDPAAHTYMHCADGRRGSSRWHEQGDLTAVESRAWLDRLPRSDEGRVLLTRSLVIELAARNSRRYQERLENVYLSALALSLDRFSFDLRWSAGNDTFFRHFGGGGPDEVNDLTTKSRLGVRRRLTHGGQLAVDFANSFLWSFAGPNVDSTASSITVQLMQPLLRGAGRAVVMEELTQSERAVLYAVRSFARFRSEFAFEVATQEYLTLLLQQQTIRDLESNLATLDANLRLYRDLFDNGTVSKIQVDQVLQSLQQGQLALFRAQVEFENQLDGFKLLLGLPPTLPVHLDLTLLEPFELNAPPLAQTQQQLSEFLKVHREMDAAPDAAGLRRAADQLRSLHQRLTGHFELVEQELARWPDKGSDGRLILTPAGAGDDRAQIHAQLGELRAELAQLDAALQAAAQAGDDKRAEAWESLRTIAEGQLEILNILVVIQTQIRASIIDLRPVDSDEPSATAQALENRLDLMNDRASVVDAWRKIEVAANLLRSRFDLEGSATIRTPEGGDNPVAFSSEASEYTVGFQFDGPLDRKLERNDYRIAQINYQRARRQFMLAEDSLLAAIRQDLRELEANRKSFETARQSLIVAARQVDQTRDQLRLADNPADSSSTQDVLRAIDDLLGAKTALIQAWVSYETSRMRLLLDQELLVPESL